jgi:hypothetical protein
MLNLLFSSKGAFEFVGLKLTWYDEGQIGNRQLAMMPGSFINPE